MKEVIVLFRDLTEYLKRLGNENNDKNNQKESTILNQILSLTIFTLFNCIEGYSEEKKIESKVLKTTVHQMECDEYMV